MMKGFSALVLLISLISEGRGQMLALSTSDSALYYYYQGWEQVLDYGHFTKSEEAYRKMYAHDPQFWVGACLLARITQDPAEREALIREIETNADNVTGHERLLLELFLNLSRIFLLRESGEMDKVAEHVEETFRSGESTLSLLSREYPDDVYYKSEYIEVLHRNHGPALAVDSLDHFFKKTPPFMLGYRSQLLAELDEFDTALEIARQLETLMQGKPAPYVAMVFAKVYHEIGKTSEALKYIDQALDLDPRHILAKRLKNELVK